MNKQLTESPARQIHDFLVERQSKFQKLDAAKILSWEQECEFAKQQILKNSYTLKIAMDNRGSLQESIFNVAAIGLSLNPAQHYAYLVPRDGRIVLDISYRGLIKLAVEAGVVVQVKAELVYEMDEFQYNGAFEYPHFTADVFAENRGELRGAFCIAMLKDGIQVDHMSAKEIYKTRDTSMAYKAVESGKTKHSPWHDWFEQMALKTMVKRASKMWPEAPGISRLQTAVSVLNTHEGIETEPFTAAQKEEFDAIIEAGDAIGLLEFRAKVGNRTYINLCNSAPAGEKVKLKDVVRKLESAAHEVVVDIAATIESLERDGDIAGAREIWEEHSEFEQGLISKNAHTDWFLKEAAA